MDERAHSSMTMLEAALNLEEKGRAYYEKALRDVQSTLGREMLDALMREELVHMDRIRLIAARLKTNQSWNEEWKTLTVEKNEVNAIFDKMKREHKNLIRAAASDLDVLKLGIDLELESIAFYEDRLKRAQDLQEKAFLTQIIGEERGHHASLVDMQLFLTNPQAWFGEHEHSSLDGA
ncbi:MAG: ferritin family protein [Syntrophaceae bacterium]